MRWNPGSTDRLNDANSRAGRARGACQRLASAPTGRRRTQPNSATEPIAANAHQVDTNSSSHSNQQISAPVPISTPSSRSPRSPESRREPTGGQEIARQQQFGMVQPSARSSRGCGRGPPLGRDGSRGRRRVQGERVRGRSPGGPSARVGRAGAPRASHRPGPTPRAGQRDDGPGDGRRAVCRRTRPRTPRSDAPEDQRQRGQRQITDAPCPRHTGHPDRADPDTGGQVGHRALDTSRHPRVGPHGVGRLTDHRSAAAGRTRAGHRRCGVEGDRRHRGAVLRGRHGR